MLSAFARHTNKIQELKGDTQYNFQMAISAIIGKFGKKCTDARGTVSRGTAGDFLLKTNGPMDFVVPLCKTTRGADMFTKYVFQGSGEPNLFYHNLAKRVAAQKTVNRRRKLDAVAKLATAKKPKGEKVFSYFPKGAAKSLDTGLPTQLAYKTFVHNGEKNVTKDNSEMADESVDEEIDFLPDLSEITEDVPMDIEDIIIDKNNGGMGDEDYPFVVEGMRFSNEGEAIAHCTDFLVKKLDNVLGKEAIVAVEIPDILSGKQSLLGFLNKWATVIDQCNVGH
jgi:hypothetical protein